jgi:hypothetical protein
MSFITIDIEISDLDENKFISFFVDKLDSSIDDFWPGFEVLFRMIRRLSRFPFQPNDVEDRVDFEGFTRALSLLMERMEHSLSAAADYGTFGLYEGFVTTVRSREPTDFRRMIFRSLAQVERKGLSVAQTNTRSCTYQEIPVISFQCFLPRYSNRAEDDWNERAKYLSRWEDERSIDALDVMSIVHGAVPGTLTSKKPYRSFYEQGLCHLTLYHHYLHELAIPYDDLVNLAKAARALCGFATRFDNEEDEDENEAIERFTKYMTNLQKVSSVVDWATFDDMFSECEVSIPLNAGTNLTLFRLTYF